MYSSDDPDYARQRLVNTIIMHNGKAVVVTNIKRIAANKPLEVSAQEILTGDLVADKIVNYDLTPIKIGFINHGRECAYVTRKPLRNDWRQGFRWSQAVVHYASGGVLYENVNIAKAAENLYPEIDEIREMVRRRGGTLAWCHNFALNNAEQIFYRGFGKIGELVDRTNKYILDNEFSWVEERLKKVL